MASLVAAMAAVDRVSAIKSQNHCFDTNCKEQKELDDCN